MNALCPGFNATDMTTTKARSRPPKARRSSCAATFGPDGPTGTFFDANGTVGW